MIRERLLAVQPQTQRRCRARVYLSVLGYLGIDWAYGFDKVWDSAEDHRIHFILGQEF